MIGLVGALVGFGGTMIGLVGALVGLGGTRIGLVGTAVGLGCLVMKSTGVLMGMVGITIPGETSTGGLIISGLIARARMEASFAMTALKKKRTATVKVR